MQKNEDLFGQVVASYQHSNKHYRQAFWVLLAVLVMVIGGGSWLAYKTNQSQQRRLQSELEIAKMNENIARINASREEAQMAREERARDRKRFEAARDMFLAAQKQGRVQMLDIANGYAPLENHIIQRAYTTTSSGQKALISTGSDAVLIEHLGKLYLVHMNSLPSRGLGVTVDGEAIPIKVNGEAHPGSTQLPDGEIVELKF